MRLPVLLLLMAALVGGGSAYADKVIPGDVWLSLGKEAKLFLIVGYRDGVREATLTASLNGFELWVPKLDKGDTEKNIEAMGRHFDAFEPVRTKTLAEHGVPFRHPLEQIVAQIDFFYQDPANKAIPWFQLVAIAQQRLDGNDVGGALRSRIRAQ